MKSFIFPVNETGWLLAPETFEQLLHRKFPGVQTRLREGKLSFAIPPEPHVEAELKRYTMDLSLSVVIDYGSISGIIAFCLWYRTLVPTEQKLLFCDEAMNFKVDLTPSTTAEDIKREVGWP